MKNADSRHPVESAGHGAPRVAGRGDQHGQFPARITDIGGHQARHEPGGEILEGQRRAVKKLQDGEVFGEGFERGVEIQRGVDDPFQVTRGKLVPHERGTHRQGDFRQGHGGQPVEKTRREDGNGFRQEQSAVLRQAFEDGLPEGCRRASMVRAVVFHRIIRGFSGPRR